MIGIGLVVGLVSCKSTPPSESDTDTQSKDTDTDTDTDASNDTDDTAPPVPTADTGPEPLDCSNPPAIPATYTVLQGFGIGEDFDFDFEGRHVSVRGGNLVAKPLQGGQVLLAPNVGIETACTRMLPDGNFIVCNVAENSLDLVNIHTGGKSVILSGMAYPNGGEVDPDGFVYIAEQNAGRVRRIDPYTGDSTTLAINLNAPNGVIFSPNYETLYVGSFGGGTVWAIDRIGTDTFAAPRVFAQHPGVNGGFDGINVDECGNVYLTEFGPGLLWRLVPNGLTVTPGRVANLPSSWIPNMRWGHGVGGFQEDVLYVSDRDSGRLFAVEIGLKGKPGFPPPASPAP